MGIVVQKFGGTSLRDEKSLSFLLKQVIDCKKAGNKVVVVVSAMGRDGEPYATDTLIKLLSKINPTVDPKKKDLLMSCGEVISCSVVAHLLDTQGISAEALTGFQAGITTSHEFTNSNILHIDTSRILSLLKEDKVVVIAGFQGATESFEITTLGRGGSDTTAVALGGYLQADRVDIFTDVLGVALIDPRVIPTAPYIRNISYKDMIHLACNGTKVLHHRAVKTAQEFQIPVRVRSTFSEDLGTLISNNPSKAYKNVIGISLDKEIAYLKIKKDLSLEKLGLENTLILYKESADFIEAYINQASTLQLSEVEKNSTVLDKKTVGSIFICFDKDKLSVLKAQINEFITSINQDLIDVFWGADNVSLITLPEHITPYIEKLYGILDS